MRRWEIERGLPVHRVPGAARGVVFAFSDELEEWLRHPHEGETTESDPKEGTPGPFLVSDLTVDRSGQQASPQAGQEAASSPGAVARTTAGIPLHTRLLPWLVAAALALAVSVGVYSYRQTARFAARAAGSHEAATKPEPHVPSPEVQDLYLKGRYYWSKRNPEDLNKAVDYFTQTIVEDPSYAPAFVGLADCYNLLREFGAMPNEEAFPRALAAAQRGVELDDSSAEAHTSLAFASFYWNWDAPAAESEFKRALRLNPNFVQGHHWYATFLLALGRFPEALDQIEQARKLDPSSTTILADKGFILWHAGHRSEAIALLRQLEATDPALATTHAYLGEMYFARKDYANSFAETKRAAKLRNDADAVAVAEAAKRGFAAGGIRGMHEAMLPVQQKIVAAGRGSAYDLASTCASLGKNEDALRYLQAALDKRNMDLIFLSREKAFNGLHDDPTFKQIEAKVDEHLPKTAPQ